MPSWPITQPEPRTVPPKTASAATLGRDIAFAAGNLVVAANGDYQTVEGEPNVRASLERRLVSPLGSFVFRPTYGAGLRRQVNAPMDAGTLSLTANRARDQAKSDRRVREAIVAVERRGVDQARILVKARLRQVPGELAPIEFQV